MAAKYDLYVLLKTMNRKSGVCVSPRQRRRFGASNPQTVIWRVISDFPTRSRAPCQCMYMRGRDAREVGEQQDCFYETGKGGAFVKFSRVTGVCWQIVCWSHLSAAPLSCHAREGVKCWRESCWHFACAPRSLSLLFKPQPSIVFCSQFDAA